MVRRLAGLFLLMVSLVSGASEGVDAQALSALRNLPPGYSTGYGYQWLKQVKADGAFQSGYRGLGVSVAVVDTGVDLKNSRLVQNLKPGATFVSGPAGGQDDHGHGTFVAGLIAGSLNNAYTAGLAPDVSILPVKVLTASGAGTGASVSQGVMWAANQGAKVINLSLGATAPMPTAGLSYALQKGSLLVVASGNEGAANPSWPGRYAKEAWAAGRMVVVGAVDSSNKMPSWSNKAGDVANWYLVAPGVNLISSTYKAGTTGVLASGSGTSFATPLVSAAAADILSKWSYLNAAQVAQILFQTATPLGSATNAKPDPVYGWGLLNVKAALNPVGPLRLPVANGSASPVLLTATSLKVSSVVGTKGLGSMTLTAVDDFGRAYSTSARGLMQEAAPLNAMALFNAMDAQFSLVEAQKGGLNLKSSWAPTAGGLGVDARVLMTQYTDAGLVSAGTAGAATHLFGLTEQLGDLPTQSLLENPYLKLAPNAGFVAAGVNTGNNASIKVGFLNNQVPSLVPGALTENALPSNGIMAEYVQPHARGVLKFGYGVLAESKSYLGVTGTEGFGGNSGKTQHIDLAGTWALSPRALVAAQLGLGYTRVSGSGGLIEGADVQTRSWTLSAASRDVLQLKDTVVVSVSEPLHVVRGDALVQLPQVSPDTGDISFARQKVSLASSPRYTVALGYSAPVGKHGKLRAELHQQVGASQTAGGLKYVQSF